jgi:hypothetical protein
MNTAVLPDATPAAAPQAPPVVDAAPKVGVNSLPEATVTIGGQPAAVAPKVDPPKADTKPPEPTADAKPAAPAKQPSLLDGDAAPAETPKPADAKAPDVKPAETAVTYALKAPDKSPLTADDLKSIEAYARDKKLTPEAAQALVDRESATVQAVRTTVQEQAKKDLESLRETFATETKADPEIGGPKLKETITLANRALAMPGVEEFAAMLKASPWANDRRTLKALAAFGRLTAEDTIIAGAPASAQAPKSAVDRWYPKQ